MTSEDFGALEQELLALGDRERTLEETMLALRRRSRQSGLAKNFEDSDEAWSIHEELKIELADVKLKITAIEIRLYSSRRLRN